MQMYVFFVSDAQQLSEIETISEDNFHWDVGKMKVGSKDRVVSCSGFAERVFLVVEKTARGKMQWVQAFAGQECPVRFFTLPPFETILNELAIDQIGDLQELLFLSAEHPTRLVSQIGERVNALEEDNGDSE